MEDSFEKLLHRWMDGDETAREQVMTMVYAELRRMAGYYFRNESAGHTLQPTALVNELFLKMSAGESISWQDRTHFFALAARQMRNILIDHARRIKAFKRRDPQISTAWLHRSKDSEPRLENLLTVDQILRDLQQLDTRAAEVVELRVFGGLKESEIAAALGISIATVKRDWSFAKAWLVSRLKE